MAVESEPIPHVDGRKARAGAWQTAHALAETDELPSAEERRSRALRTMLRLMDHPGSDPRDRAACARVILEHSPAADPMSELRARLGTPAKLKAWALAVAEGAQREIDASAAGGKAWASSPKDRQESAPAGASLQSAKDAGDSPAGEPSE